MKLLGEANWYLPAWLEWLPELRHDDGPVGDDVVATGRDREDERELVAA